MEKRQTKISKTYRLMPETIQDIQDIKDSFRKNRYEFSSDAAVIQYAVGQTKDFVQSVDEDLVNIRLNKAELEYIMRWYKYSEADFGAGEIERKAIDKITDALDSF